MIKKILFLMLSFIIFLFSVSCNDNLTKQKIKVSWKVSTQKKQWHDMPEINLIKEKKGIANIVIDIKSQKQEIDGFGGSFNEKGWIALSVLTPEEREEVIKELFDPVNGARYNICRVPIGASDYAISRYSLNETKDDFEMKNFSIERDREHLLPYIKLAMKYKPDLQIFASAWTPPSWMKTNNFFDAGSMKDDPKIYGAYAFYLAKFINAYQSEGINVICVAVQNEPVIDRNYPTCLWAPKQFLVFIRDYMGPTFEKMNIKNKIMLGTINDGSFDLFPKTVLSDPKANSYVSYVGYQWGGLNCVAATRSKYPEKKIMQTETECGNFYWRADFEYNPNFPQNDWAYGIYTWNKINDYFTEGVNSYLLWNMILDEEGKSIDSKSPWPQNAAVVVDKNTKKVIYTPMFYAFKHFTYFVKPGAHLIETVKGNDYAVSFLNPDGELVIVLQNKDKKAKDLNINLGDYYIKAKLPEMSWSTLVVPKIEL